jgi:hypothetical protein
VREIYARDPLVFPASAERILVIKETELLYNIIHDEVGVNTGLRSYQLLVGFTEFLNLVYF